MAPFERNPNWPETWPGPRLTDRPTLIELLMAAQTDVALMQQLTDHTIQTLYAWGVGENWKAVVRWLGLPDETTPEEVRDSVLAHLGDKDCSV